MANTLSDPPIASTILLVLTLIGAGPTRADDAAWNRRGPDGGRVLSLAVDPVTTATVYAGTRSAGDGLAVSYGEIALDPADPAVVYAGTRSHGLFRSVDAGATWESVSTGVELPSVNALVVGPDRTVYVGTESGLFSYRDGPPRSAIGTSACGDCETVARARREPSP